VPGGGRCFAIGVSAYLALAPAAATAADASPADSTIQVHSVYASAFLTAGEPPWTDLRLRAFVPSSTLIGLVPPRPGAYGMIGLRCLALSAKGRLDDCEISVEPAGLGYEAVGEQAVRELQVEPDQARELRPRLRFLSIQIRASNTAGAAHHGPCWPPRCNFVPAPPPPPPPPSVEPPPSPQF
jgi:hypothetical protein